ncbi:hypothetical protein [Marinomonas sp. 2405UD68-3]|uniref:hypothetical protein n=1 Tax=Marinomonas sp. 2405UD68-3 TaxID=3391835 RepID=UPI0039C9A704
MTPPFNKALAVETHLFGHFSWFALHWLRVVVDDVFLIQFGAKCIFMMKLRSNLLHSKLLHSRGIIQ